MTTYYTDKYTVYAYKGREFLIIADLVSLEEATKEAELYNKYITAAHEKATIARVHRVVTF